MEYASLKELYLSILPAFSVKKRLLSKTKYSDTTNEEIWSYLAKTKWSKSNNLTIFDMVNDIITLDIEEIYK